ncbi:MAG: ATP-dependent metallopeptidase FtsH/Yme1/Tma family protein [Gammaproteobacteria bacterium]|nr:ATP-dependent zinc metalloprotease FtsH [Gammaproteobacteria bacterium]MCP5200876.1 ATP-dependent metallopeptidase FtsH/Yme1/Tma family protein [Gammaproteobacteria bacterium]
MKATRHRDAHHEPDIEINKTSRHHFWQQPQFTLLLYLVFIVISAQFWREAAEARRTEIPYSEFLQHVDKHEVAEAVVTDSRISGTLTTPDPGTGQAQRFYTIPLWNQELADKLAAQGVRYSVRREDNWLTNFVFNWMLPFGVVFLAWSWMARRIGGMGRGFLSIGNRVRVHPDERPKVTFDDVAGYDEVKQELRETVEFLRDPSRIAKLGARSPKGVLLVGPPGTGKTLFARAVAGEAGVPFFNISGSEFIEMFVGVGAARVREMFDQARQKAPCIIFIDELDAIGRTRSAGPALGGHDEREQTLNQLLTEMDGFDASTGVVVMAATNRPEILDQALLRAGRFDRRIPVDKPDVVAREGILRLYAERMPLTADVELHVVALRTPGFVGADLENICNEAAMHALREGRERIGLADFEAAIDRVVAGPENRQRVLSAAEKHRVAVHEAGHALVAVTVPTGEPVHRVTIIPRAIGALGFTLQLPVTEKYLSTTPEMQDQVAVLLGGRAAEQLVLGSVSSGAANDLERATEIAHTMVTRLGMSEALGPVVWGRQQQLQYLTSAQTVEERNFSEATAQAIDAAVRAIVETGRDTAQAILHSRRDALDAIAAALETRETLDGAAIERLVAEHPPAS